MGTAKQNFDDMIEKGRGSTAFLVKKEQGESNCNSKLTDEQVIEIRRQHRAGATYRAIKSQFGIKSNGHVRNIITGKLWGHLIAKLI